ncbi:hypothetical protein LPJ61_002613 [Coemansia biformis]|uniref:Uncharacterized protein n=1 Tax=Coemansia biformis TaxID=1286918 RepID=A0A9W7YEM3_9FUNG|nr:hypothetical protein LPJ61_002613 [Coemansia biformis]
MAAAAPSALRAPRPGIAASIDGYFATAPPAAPLPRDVGLAHRVLRSCRALAAGLDRIHAGAAGHAVLDPCRPALDDVGQSVARVLQVLQAPGAGQGPCPSAGTGPGICPAHGLAGPECLVCASRRAARALRACVAALADSAQSDDADGGAVQGVSAALAAATVEADQARRELAAAGSIASAEAAPRAGPWDTDSGRRAVQEALAAASALAESLRVFARASQQSRPAARPPLAHSPSVPSPLSASSSPARHRRWVSEEIEGDALVPASGPRAPAAVAPGAGATAAGSGGALHTRNCSDSHIQPGGAQAAASLRKSALSLRRPPGPPDAADHAERAKQVRFQAAPAPDVPGADEASVAELLQLLARLEAAAAALAAAHRGGAGAGTCAPAAKDLVAAFVQISRLSSASGLVRHYGRAALTHFKATTQAVKLLVPLIT